MSVAVLSDASGAQALAEATRAQSLAARPDVSVWVSANAGSGKTRVLTNRVARLLLSGADPSRILCLTYTKAAAAEMQNRLFAMLGGWTMAEDAALRADLAALLSEGEPAPDRKALAAARRLFARALETPGGLRIQTIHAFCEGLLSRFPLEARVSPQFQVIDEPSADALIGEARDEAVAAALAEDPLLWPALELVMTRLKETGFDELIAAMRGKRAAYEAAGPEAGVAALAAFLGADPALSPEDLIERWAAGLDRAALAGMADAFARSDKTSAAAAAAALREAARETSPPLRRFEVLKAALLKQDGAAKTHNFPTQDVTDADPTLAPRLRKLQDGLEDLRRGLLAAERFEASAAAARLASAILGGYAARKAERAALDYDDLIQSAVALLTRSDARDWVRYKLDGGVEHILVDEAQDTSPAQWAAIEALAEEFFAGAGAERGGETGAPPAARTLFAVGDEKQSIYSFQGAAPELLSDKGAAFAERAAAAGARFERAGMATSFRSTPAVLGFVDRVFADPAARKGLAFGPAAAEAAPVRHRAYRSGAPGQVDLWPLIEPAETPDEPPWDEPVDAPPPDDPRARLARLVAEEIVGWIGREPLPARGRAIRAGDVLVLVRKREPYSSLMIKALKALGAPVSGADRLSLTEELAVKDLLALGRFCLAPDDDLTVATLLRSPFCDVDEAALFDLAHRRPGRRRLFYELQARRNDCAAFAEAYAFLSAALRRADFERPYELFAYALGPLDGRRRLLARLGAEAQDPIDELLAEALRFERAGGPTLEAFSLALTQRDIEIKREHEQGRDEIRVMTAHGAKGLEAPVVVLPDMMGAASGGRNGPLLLDPAPPLGASASATQGAGGGDAPPPIWAGRKEEDPPALAALRAAAEEKEAEEHRRLLYVALTRAEDRLLICGAKGKQEKAGSWYRLCEAAFLAGASPDGADDAAAIQDWGAAGRVERAPSPVRGASGAPLSGYRLIGRGTEAAPPSPPAAAPPTPEPPPSWLWAPAAKETAPADIRPSDLGGEDPERADPAAADAFGASALDPESAAQRGVLIHRLLERLPLVAAAGRTRLAARLIAEAGEATRFGAEALAEAEAVLAAPELAPLFGPGGRAEVAFAAVLPALGPGEIHGVIDRIVVSPDRVLIVDYKTGAPPAAPPEAYLRQLAVYRAAMQALYPGRAVETALLWTAAPRLEHIAASALDQALGRAAAALDPLMPAP